MTLRHIVTALLALFLASAFSPLSGQDGLGLRTVVIDPGHGGTDPGCISADKKTQEQTLVLSISEKLKAKIEAGYPDVNVLLTRSSSTFVPLIDRAKFATNSNADLFISIHINATDRGTSANGFSVHLLGPSDKSKNTYAFNMEVCKKENDVILLEDDYTTTYQGFDPDDPESDIFLRLMHNAYREQSLLFGQLVTDKLSKGPFRKSNGILQNNFAVLRQATMPALLLELGFITNPTDLAVLRADRSLDQIAQALYDAFKEYKALYDESVGAPAATEKKSDVQKPAAATPAAKEPAKEPATVTPAAADEDVYYATQVLASAKFMKADDKYFQGYDMKYIQKGTLYKYMIGVSTDRAEAEKMYQDIKIKFKDSFFVKVEKGASTRLK